MDQGCSVVTTCVPRDAYDRGQLFMSEGERSIRPSMEIPKTVDGGVCMPLMVSGRVHHHHMHPDRVRAKLSERLPGLLVRTPEFALEQNGCKIEFFCNTTSTLDFTVTRIAASGPAPAAVTDLAREAQNINSAVLRALGRKFRKAEFGYCYIEDEKSRSSLLTWVRTEPLKSRPRETVVFAMCRTTNPRRSTCLPYVSTEAKYLEE